MKTLYPLLVLVIWACGPALSRADMVNAIQAVVHDSVITYLEVEALTEQTADVVKAQNRGRPAALQRELNKMRAENLNKLVQDQLILHEFATAGYKLPESTLDEIVQEKLKSRWGDRVTATKSLEALGLTPEKYRRQVRDQFIVEQLRLKNISRETIISPHKIEDYYLAHRDEFKVEDQVKLRMIVLTNSASEGGLRTRRMGEEILGKLKEGAPFAEMASVYSQGSQRAQGGDWGWVERPVLRKELAAVAFSLKPGERSGVIETDEACYLMLVEDVRTAHYKALAEVREQIDKDLLQQESARLEKKWLDRLKKKTFVVYY
ncbi:MAG TPA: peptidylprolyl isomerase [Verrucomicrobiae bacterium]